MALLANLMRCLSTTTGTGTITIGSAVAGFLNPSQSGMVDGQTYSYAIEADYTSIGDDLVPQSREIGTGTYASGASTLTRSVINSTNGNALLNLAGDAQVIITPQASMFRDKLSAGRTYYVRADGSDSNTGLVNNAGGAFLTIQHAYDVVSSFDTNGFATSIQVNDGTYSPAGIGLSTGPGWIGGGSITINGTGSSLVTLNAGSHGIAVTGPITGILQVTNMKIISGAYSLYHVGDGIFQFGGIDFGTASNFHVYSTVANGYIQGITNYSISGGAIYHMVAQYGAIQTAGLTVTLTGTPAFTGAYILATRGGKIGADGMTFTGSATGARYTIDSGGLIYTSGGGASYFPGNSAGAGGTTAGGGFYI